MPRPEPRNIPCKQLSKFFARCEDYYPVSDRYISEVHDSSLKTGRTEREHMAAWFRDSRTKGAGSFSRAKGNDSGRTCYQRLQNAASLLWIAEAAGVAEATVESAFNAAKAAGDHRRACGAVKRVIPWDTVYDALVSTGKVSLNRRFPFGWPR
ncbi:MAG: hypothetical protein IJ087_08735 [Eggerthellaceae bacterium]|nr:hypothetical protein [Eggerthellaceae bacterium]